MLRSKSIEGANGVMRIVNDYPDIDSSDLIDNSNTAPASKLGKYLSRIALLLLIPIGVVALVLGSLPEMSPAQIVGMEGYVSRHESATREIEVSPPRVASLLSPQATDSAGETPLREEPIAGFDTREPLTSPATDQPEAVIELREIAAAQPAEKSAQAGQATGDNASYPVLRVKRQYSNVRSDPSLTADIITSLELGSMVTVFDRRGDWLQVGVNDGSSVTGYIHKSLLGIVPASNN